MRDSKAETVFGSIACIDNIKLTAPDKLTDAEYEQAALRSQLSDMVKAYTRAQTDITDVEKERDNLQAELTTLKAANNELASAYEIRDTQYKELRNGSIRLHKTSERPEPKRFIYEITTSDMCTRWWSVNDTDFTSDTLKWCYKSDVFTLLTNIPAQPDAAKAVKGEK